MYWQLFQRSGKLILRNSFVPFDGGTQVEMYVEPNEQGMYYEGACVWFVLHGLYKYDWQANAKGSQLSPGSYKIRFWAGETMYTSEGTYTVTGSRRRVCDASERHSHNAFCGNL